MPIGDRQHFRIRYPEELRPEVIINGARYTLIDISTAGMKVEYKEIYMPEKDTELTIGVGFQTGAQITVKGVVVRVDGKNVMIRLVKLVPLIILESEAALLLEKYGVVPTDSYD